MEKSGELAQEEVFHISAGIRMVVEDIPGQIDGTVSARAAQLRDNYVAEKCPGG